MLTRRGFLKTVAWLGASTTSFAAYAVGIEPLLWTRTVTYRLTPPGWPPDLKLRVVALADIHAVDPWMTADRIQGLVDTANGLGGDVIVLLGDYVSGTRLFRREGLASEWGPILGRLKAPLGVHAILGNHDWWEDKTAMARGAGPTFVHAALAEAGITVLENSAIRLQQDGKPFWLAGLGDQLAFVPVRRRLGLAPGIDDLAKTERAVTDDAPAILLAHEPDIFLRRYNRFALTLCGHTHGGQVNLFGWRPAAGSIGSRIYPRGVYREPNRDLIVSSGLGCSIAPVRIGVPPEIMVVELGGAPSDSAA